MANAMIPTPQCSICGKISTIAIPMEKMSQVTRWRFYRQCDIKDILPEITEEEETLLLTGIHRECRKAETNE